MDDEALRKLAEGFRDNDWEAGRLARGVLRLLEERDAVAIEPPRSGHSNVMLTSIAYLLLESARVALDCRSLTAGALHLVDAVHAELIVRREVERVSRARRRAQS